MGSSSVGEGLRVNVPSGVVVGSRLTGLGVAVAGMAVARGKTAWGLGGSGVDVGIGAITTGVGEAPPHALKRDIPKVSAIPILKSADGSSFAPFILYRKSRS